MLLSILQVKVLSQELVCCLCSYGVRVEGARRCVQAAARCLALDYIEGVNKRRTRVMTHRLPE